MEGNRIMNKNTLPEQCVNCILQDVCLEDNCIKEKPCLSRKEDKPVDADLLEEMKERMEFVR